MVHDGAPQDTASQSVPGGREAGEFGLRERRRDEQSAQVCQEARKGRRRRGVKVLFDCIRTPRAPSHVRGTRAEGRETFADKRARGLTNLLPCSPSTALHASGPVGDVCTSRHAQLFRAFLARTPSGRAQTISRWPLDPATVSRGDMALCTDAVCNKQQSLRALFPDAWRECSRRAFLPCRELVCPQRCIRAVARETQPLDSDRRARAPAHTSRTWVTRACHIISMRQANI